MDFKSLPEKMSKMNPEEREKLAAKLDAELDSYISNLEASAGNSKYQCGWTEENWEEEMEKHPFFATSKEGKEMTELSPLMQGISDLKYNPDENTYEELAMNYKDEGNFHFKNKKYRLAVANYTEGLKLKIPDPLFNTQLLTNRAAAQFHLGNYRSSLMDCRLAVRLTPNHGKAILRGAQCSMKLKRPLECIEWCDRGLATNPEDKVLSQLRIESADLQKTLERDERKKAALEKKQKKEEQTMINAITSRGISIAQNKGAKHDDDDEDEGSKKRQTGVLDLSTLEPSHPAAVNKRVHFVEEDGISKLAWPVLFMYPEHTETDFIEEFVDDQAFEDHLMAMFGPGIERPPWDSENKYLPHQLKIYYEDMLNVSSSPKLVSVSQTWTLLEAIKDPRFKVMGGTPAFVILVEGSPFQAEFLSKYK